MSFRIVCSLTIAFALINSATATPPDTWDNGVMEVVSLFERLHRANTDYRGEMKRVILKKPELPPICPVTPNPLAAYTLGPLGNGGNLGQNGWWIVSVVDSNPVESVSNSVPHDGSYSWFIGECDLSCNEPIFAAYPGPGLGGFGAGIAGEPPIVEADRVRVSVWVRALSPLPVATSTTGFIEININGVDSVNQPITSLKFGDVSGSLATGVLSVQTKEVVGGTGANPTTVLKTSVPLTTGRWYELITDLTFVKGELNDKVRYEVRDSTGLVIWKYDGLSLEHAYWLGANGYPANSGEPLPYTKVNARRVTIRNAVGADTTSGFYVDDVTLTAWAAHKPSVPLYCFSTSFEQVAQQKITGYGPVA